MNIEHYCFFIFYEGGGGDGDGDGGGRTWGDALNWMNRCMDESMGVFVFFVRFVIFWWLVAGAMVFGCGCSCGLFATSCWPLAIGYWLLAIGLHILLRALYS